ncbi:hypothetical protein RB653_004414 [Dictyostelium firmibasis]|uniref:MRH domain-containing protein n=1 Tax=Dictyostelium firmibasis TaxID=79012 RepID=A0AAN7YX18_9MYCE
MKIIFLFLLIVGVINISKSYDCNVEIGGYGYDLTPLRKNDGYQKVISDYGDILYFNFCNTTIDTPCGNSALAYLFDGSNGVCNSLGVQEFYSINSIDEKKTLMVNIRGGDIAYDSMVKMFELFIVFNCDENDDSSDPILINTMEYGYASVVWTTKYACPIKTPNSQRNKLLKEIEIENQNNKKLNNNKIENENEDLNVAQSNAFENPNKIIQSPNEIMYKEIAPINLQSNNHFNKININGVKFLDKLDQMSQTINSNKKNENNHYYDNTQYLNQEKEKETNLNIENDQFNNEIKPIDMELPLLDYENDDALIDQLNDDIKSEQDQNKFEDVSVDEIANQIMDYLNNNNDKTKDVNGDFIREDLLTPNFIVEDSKLQEVNENIQLENGF